MELELREDVMDATLAMLTHLMERMDASDMRQAAMGEELRAFYAAVPARSACAAIANHTARCPAPWAPRGHPPPPPSEPSEEDSISLSPGHRATVPTLDTLKQLSLPRVLPNGRVKLQSDLTHKKLGNCSFVEKRLSK